MNEKYIQRFWSKVDKEKSQIFYDGERCWEWIGSMWDNGYGNFWQGIRLVASHRFSWELVNGDIPSDLFALHHCDNPSCVNPSHLFLGTDRDNTDDKVRKNRQSRLCGERNGRSKLTADEVKSIREMYATGMKQGEIAHKSGISRPQVCAIVNFKSWK